MLQSTFISTYLRDAGELISGSDTARLDVEILLCKILSKPRSFLYSHPEYELTETEKLCFFGLLQRRQSGEPIAYITGEKEFWSLSLQVNDSTLIPRPETELLVEIGLELFSKAEYSALDLGCGTGAIALALATERPLWKIQAVDSCEEAVQLANKNCRTFALSNVDISRSNWFEIFVNRKSANRKFDLIVSNPPYIDKDDSHLSQGDVRFEPHSALVAKNSGLADIEHIISHSQLHLNIGGWLALEHGFDQAVSVQNIFANNNFDEVETWKDLADLDRVTFGQYKQ